MCSSCPYANNVAINSKNIFIQILVFLLYNSNTKNLMESIFFFFFQLLFDSSSSSNNEILITFLKKAYESEVIYIYVYPFPLNLSIMTHICCCPLKLGEKAVIIETLKKNFSNQL